MGAGTGKVPIEIFVNDAIAKNSLEYPVNGQANPSKMAIGTERDATNHPGTESFDGSISRIFVYERPLDEKEMKKTMEYLKTEYSINDD